MAEITRLPGPVADLWDWQLDGACRGVSPEVFFHPEGERGPRRRNRDAQAKAVCAACPVWPSAARTPSRSASPTASGAG